MNTETYYKLEDYYIANELTLMTDDEIAWLIDNPGLLLSDKNPKTPKSDKQLSQQIEALAPEKPKKSSSPLLTPEYIRHRKEFVKVIIPNEGEISAELILETIPWDRQVFWRFKTDQQNLRQVYYLMFVIGNCVSLVPHEVKEFEVIEGRKPISMWEEQKVEIAVHGRVNVFDLESKYVYRRF